MPCGYISLLMQHGAPPISHSLSVTDTYRRAPQTEACADAAARVARR